MNTGRAKAPVRHTLAAAACILLAACADLGLDVSRVAAPANAEPELTLTAVPFEELPGWAGEAHAEVLPVMLRSCERLERMDDDRKLGDHELFGTAGEWKEICEDAAIIRPGNQVEARYFFESRFQPYLAGNNFRSVGLFTGYYEPELRGSWNRSLEFSTPMYARPRDIIAIDLGLHRDEYAGTQLAGRLVENRLIPYYSRAEIEAGALEGRELEILWVDDAVDAFFMHIQGSGRVRLPDDSTIRLGFSGRNGHRYTSIGRELVAMGEMNLKDVTAPAIRQWLRDRPAAARELMQRNASYVFFRVIDGDGPIGAQGVPLTPGRSIAVDDAFYPYGIPLWLDTTDPLQPDQPLRRIMVAQDTGSAITGPVRGDVFWGHGEDAGLRAGLMKQEGEYYILLPRRAPLVPSPAS